MKLRIISGALRGRYITVSDSKDFRPTLERTRESICEIIKSRIENAYVADICAGSGAMGFEMLSRGAIHVDFIERDRFRAEQIKKSAQTLSVFDKCNIISKDIRSFLKQITRTYDIIYYDPPYSDEDLKSIPALLLDKLSPEGILLYEFRKQHKNKEMAGTNLHSYDTRVFGDTVVEFYTHRMD